MLLLWIDILTRTVCAEQAKQQAAQTDKLVPPAEAGSQPNLAATHSTPRSVDAKALDWEIKDIPVHRSRCTCILRLSKRNTHIHSGGLKRVGGGGSEGTEGVLILIFMQTPNWPTPPSSALLMFFVNFISSFSNLCVWIKRMEMEGENLTWWTRYGRVI